MKKAILPIVTILICIAIYMCRNNIVASIYKFAYKDSLNYIGSNFSNDYEFEYLKKTDDFTPKNKEELIQILYTIIDSNTTEFVIFCESEYKTCNQDAIDILYDNVTLPAINTFVHPYNSYQKISFSNTDYNIIVVNINKQYSQDEINYIEDKLDSIIKEIIKDDMSSKDKLLTIHDYISDYTKYVDSDDYAKASALLLHRKARCSAYADLMAIYLSKMNIPNYRIASEKHIWNYLYIDNEWLHIDLTWDDPLLPNDKQIILHDFFLINTDKLKEFNTDSHFYDQNIYLEANKN